MAKDEWTTDPTFKPVNEEGWAIDPDFKPVSASGHAKAALSGAVDTAAGIPGMAGDIAKLGTMFGNPFDYLARKFTEAFPEQAAKNIALYEKVPHEQGTAPSSEEIKGLTGLKRFDYEPQTTGERLTKEGVGFGLSALTGGARSVPQLAGDLVRFGAAPMAASEGVRALTSGM